MTRPHMPAHLEHGAAAGEGPERPLCRRRSPPSPQEIVRMAQAKPLSRPLAIVTGASSGIGYELAKLCAENGFDLVIAADRPLGEAARDLRAAGATVDAVEADLATVEGVDRLHAAAQGRPVDGLLANA